MKIFGIITFFTLFISTSYCQFETCAITFKSSPRIGDSLISYIKAKWIAYNYNIPFSFRSFPHSTVFFAHKNEVRIPNVHTKYKRKIILNTYDGVQPESEDTLFVVPLSTRLKTIDLYERILHDDYFGQELKKMLQPAVPVNYLHLPTDKVTVAVHIRKGSWHDKPLYSIQQFQEQHDEVNYTEQILTKKLYSDLQWPTKFPPEQFYVDQLKKLSKMLKDTPMYVYIFTDDSQSQLLLNKIKTAVNLPNIEFDSHHTHNYSRTFVDDFFNMTQFDCLIRPNSGFSLVPQWIGNHKIIIYPTGAKWVEKKLIMKQVTIIRVSTNKVRKIKKKTRYNLKDLVW